MLYSNRVMEMDINLHYTEKGSGKPLILLHGNGESGEYFGKQTAYFSNQYRVIALDTRGHGRSPRGTAPFNIRQFADNLRCFMDEQEIERADILGFSDGGNIALIFAIRYPERVDRLIISGANLNAAGVKASIQIPIELGWRIAVHAAGKSEEAKRKAEMLNLMVNDPNIPEEELQKVTAPTLVMAGTRDMIKTSHTQRIYELLPDAELKIIPGDHFIAAKESDSFNTAVEDFLNRRKRDQL